MWNLETYDLLHSFCDSSSWISKVRIDADTRKAVSVSADRSLKVWDLVERTLTGNYLAHTAPASSLDITPDGKVAVSGGFDYTIKLWNINKNEDDYSQHFDSI